MFTATNHSNKMLAGPSYQQPPDLLPPDSNYRGMQQPCTPIVPSQARSETPYARLQSLEPIQTHHQPHSPPATPNHFHPYLPGRHTPTPVSQQRSETPHSRLWQSPLSQPYAYPHERLAMPSASLHLNQAWIGRHTAASTPGHPSAQRYSTDSELSSARHGEQPRYPGVSQLVHRYEGGVYTTEASYGSQPLLPTQRTPELP